MNVFEAVKQSVTTRQAADMYGVKVRRGGMACCIFHTDKTPSMKIDNRFHCFRCGADGDVIDFVVQLYDIGTKEAAEKLASDFGISYDNKSRASSRPVQRRVSPEQQLRHKADYCFRVLCDYLHLLEHWKEVYVPKTAEEQWHPRFEEALQKIPYVEYLTDILLHGDTEDKATLIIGYGKEVVQLEKRIADIKAGDRTGIEEHNGSNGAAKECGRSKNDVGAWRKRTSEAEL